jgi:urease accessory protein
MLDVKRRAAANAKPDCSLTLPFDRRQKSRLRARLDEPLGAISEVGIELERGSSLADGDLLLAETGQVVLVHAASEPLSVVSSSDPRQLLRAAYHLGNRHVALQIAPTELRYLHDRVLDDMVRSLGLVVAFANLPFEPESGAYGAGHSHLSRPHQHGHGSHSHGHHGGHEH